jgi:hypothetical protein
MHHEAETVILFAEVRHRELQAEAARYALSGRVAGARLNVISLFAAPRCVLARLGERASRRRALPAPARVARSG